MKAKDALLIVGMIMAIVVIMPANAALGIVQLVGCGGLLILRGLRRASHPEKQP